MIGEKGFEIEHTRGGDYLLEGNHYFPHWAVAPMPPEEVKKMTQEEVEKELGYKFELK